MPMPMPARRRRAHPLQMMLAAPLVVLALLALGHPAASQGPQVTVNTDDRPPATVRAELRVPSQLPAFSHNLLLTQPTSCCRRRRRCPRRTIYCGSTH